jgi:hypothetical protein
VQDVEMEIGVSEEGPAFFRVGPRRAHSPHHGKAKSKGLHAPKESEAKGVPSKPKPKRQSMFQSAGPIGKGGDVGLVIQGLGEQEVVFRPEQEIDGTKWLATMRRAGASLEWGPR